MTAEPDLLEVVKGLAMLVKYMPIMHPQQGAARDDLLARTAIAIERAEAAARIREACPACKGSGEGDAGDCPCAECGGSGKRDVSINPIRADAVSEQDITAACKTYAGWKLGDVRLSEILARAGLTIVRDRKE